MFSKAFWLGDNGALTRAARTFSQSALAMITVSTFTPFTVGAWGNVLVVSFTASAVSLLMSLDRREALLSPPPDAQPVAFAGTGTVVTPISCGDER